MDITLLLKIAHALHVMHHAVFAKILQIIAIHVQLDIMMLEQRSVINAIKIAELVPFHLEIAHHVMMDSI